MKNLKLYIIAIYCCFQIGLKAQTTYNYTYSLIGSTEASTIQGHLNNGDNVVVTTTGSSTNLQISSNILKSTGGNATLTFKSAFRVTMNVNTSIRSTSNKLNVIFWSNSTNNSSTKGMIRFGDHTLPTANVIIETNGGHLWVGGGSNNTTWNSLTVGDGYAWGCALPGGNGWWGIELYGDCRFYTNGGNIAFKGRSTDLNNGWQGASFGIYVIKSIVNAGSGSIDVTSLTDGTGTSSASTTGIAIVGDGGFTTSTGNINIVNSIDVASNSSGTATGVYLERNSTGTGSGNPVISSNQGSVNITTTMSTPASQKYFIDINELNYIRERASTAQQFTLPVRDLLNGSGSTYSSSATNVATINNSGLVTLIGTGSTNITGTFTRSDWNSFNSRWRYNLSVLNKADPNLSFSQSNIYKDISDPSFTITATQTNQTGTVGSMTYTSSNRSVATVNPSTGQVTLVGQGSALITATSANTTTYVQGETSYMLYVTNGFVVLTTGLTKSLTKVNLSGNVTSSGGNTVTERGFVYGTSPNPTISNTKLAVGSGTGNFSTTTPDLANGTYYFRAYATNSTGTIYGSQITETIDLSTLGCITIVASGGVSEGTSSSSWSYSNNTIFPNSSTNLSINASDVLNKLSSGNLTITASCITLNTALSHTSNLKSLNIIASGNIITNSTITLNGPISMTGSEIQINANLTSTNSGSAILVQASGNISTANSAKTVSTINGNISIIGDADANNNGQLNLDYTTYSSGSGNILMRGETFNWTVGSGISPTISSTTGSFTFESSDDAFGQGVESSWFFFPSTLSAFTIGKSTNTQNISFSSNALTVAGPISGYGGTISVTEDIASSNGSTISLYGNGLTFGFNRTVTSSGQLIIAPQTASNSIGLGGASGTLSLPASYFSTNFADGFSNIQIGSNTQTGAISSNAFTLRDNMTFLTSGSLTLGGRPVLGSNNVTLGSGISSISASTSGYFKTDGSGKVIRTIANASSFQFPVGNSAFNSVSISNNNSTSDVFGVRVLDEVYKDGTTGSALTTKPRIKRTWDITKATANSGGVNFTFNWNSGEEDNLSSGHALFHYGSNWDEQMGSTSVTGTSLTYTGYTGTFSPFAIGSGSTPLPVDLVSFDATPKNNTVDLTWTTFGDNRNPFNILKSTDGVKWNSIGILNPTDDNVNYLYTDHKPAAVNYYQLSQLDHSNTLQFSDIRMVNFNSNTLSVFPNPNNGEFTIQSDNVVNFQIKDFTGKVIMEGDNTNPLIKTNLLKGIYFIKISDGEKITFNKIIVQ
jgi:hypothetical protein